jgi:hypothetical protein
MEPRQTVWPPEEEKTNKLNLCFSSKKERNIFLQSKHQRFETLALCCQTETDPRGEDQRDSEESK